MTLPFSPASTPDEDLLRELHYCAFAPGGPLGGQVGRAQDRALEAGFLVPCQERAGFLAITPLGRARLARGPSMTSPPRLSPSPE